MTHDELLEKVSRVTDIDKEVYKLTVEKNVLKKEIATYMQSIKVEELEVDDKRKLQIVWDYSPMLDLKMLQEKYPQVYELGSYYAFSKDIAFANSTKNDANIIATAIKDCSIKSKSGEVVITWRRKKSTFKK